MILQRKTSLLTSLILAVVGIALATESAEAQRRFRIGGPFGIGIGGGQGLTIGGGNGVQLGGGQGLRFGPPNLGVQYGGGQLLRYGAPNAGVRVGGGEGVRLGTPRSGLQFGNGNGLQVGQLATPTQPYAIQQYPPATNFQPVQPYNGQPVYPSTVYQTQTFPSVIPPSTIQSSPTLAAPASSGFTNGVITSQPSVPQNQFDEARQPSVTPSIVSPKIQPAIDVDTGTSVLQLD